jgi:hypothetical protein
MKACLNRWLRHLLTIFITSCLKVATRVRYGSILLTICLLVSSWTSGTNKICTYECLEGTTSITIGILDACPIFL